MAQAQIQVEKRFFCPMASLPFIFEESQKLALAGPNGERFEVQRDTDDAGRLVCSVRLPTTVSQKRKRMLEQIAEGRMPEGSGPRGDAHFQELDKEQYDSYVDEEGLLKGGALPLLQHLPQSIQDFVVETSEQSFQVAEKALRLLRWRAGLSGSPSVLNLHNYFTWSDDGADWHAIWNGNTIDISFERFAPIKDEFVDFVEKAIRDGRSEPLARELFREAEALRLENPRSSLLMLVTAAEVGVKQLITASVPETHWLIENLQSPSIVGLVQHCLPSLPIQTSFRGKSICPPPEALLEEIESAVQARNRVTHRGEKPPDRESMERKSAAVSDFLWLLDYYQGDAWAINHLSHVTLRAVLTNSSDEGKGEIRPARQPHQPISAR
jgi:hypothetical protein